MCPDPPVGEDFCDEKSVPGHDLLSSKSSYWRAAVACIPARWLQFPVTPAHHLSHGSAGYARQTGLDLHVAMPGNRHRRRRSEEHRDRTTSAYEVTQASGSSLRGRCGCLFRRRGPTRLHGSHQRGRLPCDDPIAENTRCTRAVAISMHPKSYAIGKQLTQRLSLQELPGLTTHFLCPRRPLIWDCPCLRINPYTPIVPECICLSSLCVGHVVVKMTSGGSQNDCIPERRQIRSTSVAGSTADAFRRNG